jgi:hypothetical protein
MDLVEARLAGRVKAADPIGRRQAHEGRPVADRHWLAAARSTTFPAPQGPHCLIRSRTAEVRDALSRAHYLTLPALARAYLVMADKSACAFSCAGFGRLQHAASFGDACLHSRPISGIEKKPNKKDFQCITIRCNHRCRKPTTMSLR